MVTCERCGELYFRGSKHATPDFCGTCIFINGPLPEARVEPPIARQPRKRKNGHHEKPETVEETSDDED